MAVSVVDQIPSWHQETSLGHRDVARDLPHPPLVGMRCHPCNMHLPSSNSDEEKHVTRYQHTPGPELSGEEVGYEQHPYVHADELFPVHFPGTTHQETLITGVNS